MFRSPVAAVTFGDVALPWYVRQDDRPLAPSRGHLYDHIAIGVRDLDAWVAKLRGEGVRFLIRSRVFTDAEIAALRAAGRKKSPSMQPS